LAIFGREKQAWYNPPMKLKSGKLVTLDKPAEEMARNIANLKGKDLEELYEEPEEDLQYEDAIPLP
jgi:hypothetical protein